MNDAFLKERMVPGKQRKFTQYGTGLPDNQSNKSGGNSKIKQIHRHMILYNTAKNHLIKIQPVSKQQSYRHKSDGSPIPLRTSAHINQYRRKEINGQVQIENSGICTFESILKINGL